MDVPSSSAQSAVQSVQMAGDAPKISDSNMRAAAESVQQQEQHIPAADNQQQQQEAAPEYTQMPSDAPPPPSYYEVGGLYIHTCLSVCLSVCLHRREYRLRTSRPTAVFSSMFI
mgnify:CR=1 FL=1